MTPLIVGCLFFQGTVAFHNSSHADGAKQMLRRRGEKLHSIWRQIPPEPDDIFTSRDEQSMTPKASLCEDVGWKDVLAPLKTGFGKTIVNIEVRQDSLLAGDTRLVWLQPPTSLN